MSDKTWILQAGKDQTEFPTLEAVLAHIDAMDEVESVEVDNEDQVVYVTFMHYPEG